MTDEARELDLHRLESEIARLERDLEELREQTQRLAEERGLPLSDPDDPLRRP